MYLCLIVFPLIGCILSLCFGRVLGGKGGGVCTSLGVGLSAIISLLIFYEVGFCGSKVYIRVFPWFNSEYLDAFWAFQFDSITGMMGIVVTVVSFFVHLYSLSYMAEDPHLCRFMGYLSLFTFFMLILITSDNFIGLFLGWEGVGLASYLLINFWSTRIQANKSSIKAMVMNRLGDMGLAIGIMALFSVYKTVNYSTIFACLLESPLDIFVMGMKMNMLNFIGIFLFIGVMGKSAQLGLHTWLPDAMEGPTPVSALIHAATMVTAGVYLLARCSPLYEQAGFALGIVACIGGLTAIFASTIGMFQNDVKRVIAYSTCSQLGYMVFACGLSFYTIGLFHLFNHAFFKALLFLSSGCLIHGFSDEQDMRRMGGLLKMLPVTYCMILVGSLSLAGFPFLTGFYSKDGLLEAVCGEVSLRSEFIYWLGCFSVIFTSYYSFKLISLTFLRSPNGSRKDFVGIHELTGLMSLVLICLGLGSVFLGYFFKDIMIGLGTDFWGNAVIGHTVVESEFCPISVKMIPVVLSVCGGLFSLWISGEGEYFQKTRIEQKLYGFFNKRWLIDKIYNEGIGYPSLFFGYTIGFKLLDKGVLELFGPKGVIVGFPRGVSLLSSFHTGYIYHSAFTMIVGVTLLTFLIGITSLENFTHVTLDFYVIEAIGIFLISAL